MRIEAYTQVQQIYKTSKTDKSQRKPGVGATDQLQISSIGREYQTGGSCKQRHQGRDYCSSQK